MSKFLKRLWIVILLVTAILFVSYKAIQLETPELSQAESNFQPSISTIENVRYSGDSWYRKNKENLWEAYIEGDDYQRGKVFGVLAEEQIVEQEDYFIAQIQKLIPSEWFLKSLKFGISFFNRNMDDHVIPEYQRELFGISKHFADEYDFIGPKYARILNYHAAHDIGHALQDLSIVGCSSFALKNDMTADGQLLIARNFDFYMGDDFAKNKLILFNRPTEGIPYVSVTWAGFMGVVSGMNLEGLTVTLNASKSSIPTGAKTPISLLAREILQYASNIDEAIVIAEKRETFVSESILIGSAKDGRAVIIEKSPEAIDVFDPNENLMICTNHNQSENFETEQVNLDNLRDSDSKYRFDRLAELLDRSDSLNVDSAVKILRERKGVSEVELGIGNPKAINQLLAHHGIVFQPKEKRFWISTQPFQMGKFICYDLDEIFAMDSIPTGNITIDSLTISEDPFLDTKGIWDFMEFKKLKNELFDSYALGKSIQWTDEKEKRLIEVNSESYVTYMALGDYYATLGDCSKAVTFYQTSLTKEVASLSERNKLESSIEECDDSN
ncbi:MAG: isopenicillin-N N-acyltransferase-like protein [Bacteroidia bacterium]|jgi:isopenicillin-N N-acyltransferase-like protein